MVAIIGFGADTVSPEHISWDQAGVLVQLGLLDAAALPVTGAERTRNVLDPASVPSNGLILRAEVPS